LNAGNIRVIFWALYYGPNSVGFYLGHSLSLGPEVRFKPKRI